MPSHLKPGINILNSALEMGYSYFFPKENLCSFKVGDVFDGNNILARITRGNKNIDTSPALEDFLKQHIQYLRQHYSVAQDAPLFPGYEGKSGKRKLHRHIREYSIYSNFHKLIDESYRNVNKTLLDKGLDLNQRLAEISRLTGKTERGIKCSLYDKFDKTRIRQKRKPNAAKSNELPDELTKKEQNQDKLAITAQAKPVTKIEPSKKICTMDLLREAIEENK